MTDRQTALATEAGHHQACVALQHQQIEEIFEPSTHIPLESSSLCFFCEGREKHAGCEKDGHTFCRAFLPPCLLRSPIRGLVSSSSCLCVNLSLSLQAGQSLGLAYDLCPLYELRWGFLLRLLPTPLLLILLFL